MASCPQPQEAINIIRQRDLHIYNFIQLQAFKQTGREMTHFLFTYLMVDVNLSILQPQPVFNLSLLVIQQCARGRPAVRLVYTSAEAAGAWTQLQVWNDDLGEACCDEGAACTPVCVHVGGAVEAWPHKDTEVQECNGEDVYWSLALKLNAD